MPDRSLRNLNWLNFFVAGMQTGFGAFLSVYLATQGWSATDIGIALSVGTIAVMCAQVPAGAMVDALPSKRVAAAAAILGIAGAALMIGISPSFPMVLVAEIIQGIANAMLGPSIAAITLSLAAFDKLGERLGLNVRFAAIGSGSAAAGMGAIGSWYSHRAVYILVGVSAFAALAALRGVRPADIAQAPARTDHVAALPKEVRAVQARPRSFFRDPTLLIFAVCMALFTLGNAALLPLAVNHAAHVLGQRADIVTAAAIVVPQVLTAWLSPVFGRAAQNMGRRTILLIGFAALPARALLFALAGNAYLLVVFQALDGIAGGAVGVMVPLIVADITRRRGRFNLAMGIVGLAVGLAATISTASGGYVADQRGNPTAYLTLAVAGLLACLIAGLFLPETGPRPYKPSHNWMPHRWLRWKRHGKENHDANGDHGRPAAARHPSRANRFFQRARRPNPRR